MRKHLTLQEEYKDNPELLAFYEKKLLEPGWAGELTDNEAEYISKKLCEDITLRRAWRRALNIAGYTGQRRKRPSAYVVKKWNDALNN